MVASLVQIVGLVAAMTGLFLCSPAVGLVGVGVLVMVAGVVLERGDR